MPSTCIRGNTFGGCRWESTPSWPGKACPSPERNLMVVHWSRPAAWSLSPEHGTPSCAPSTKKRAGSYGLTSSRLPVSPRLLPIRWKAGSISRSRRVGKRGAPMAATTSLLACHKAAANIDSGLSRPAPVLWFYLDPIGHQYADLSAHFVADDAGVIVMDAPIETGFSRLIRRCAKAGEAPAFDAELQFRCVTEGEVVAEDAGQGLGGRGGDGTMAAGIFRKRRCLQVGSPVGVEILFDGGFGSQGIVDVLDVPALDEGIEEGGGSLRIGGGGSGKIRACLL